jgi:hypothetical protein
MMLESSVSGGGLGTVCHVTTNVPAAFIATDA